MIKLQLLCISRSSRLSNYLSLLIIYGFIWPCGPLLRIKKYHSNPAAITPPIIPPIMDHGTPGTSSAGVGVGVGVAVTTGVGVGIDTVPSD